MPGFYTQMWRGLWAPARTPKDIINKLDASVVEALADSAVRKRLADLGQEVPPRDEQTPRLLPSRRSESVHASGLYASNQDATFEVINRNQQRGGLTMAWQVPLSQTGPGIIVNLGETDSAFIASGVTVSSKNFHTIAGFGSNHHVIVYGTVAGSIDAAVVLGDQPAVNSNNRLTVKAGGHIQGLGEARRHHAGFPVGRGE